VLGQRDKLQGTPHQVSVTLGHEFDPSNGGRGRRALSGRHEVDEPGLVKIPARLESPETKFLRSGRGTLRLGSLRGGGGSDGVGHNPLPSGSGKRSCVVGSVFYPGV
jgi:hypothetical protein